MKKFISIISMVALVIISACSGQEENTQTDKEFKIEFEKFTLENGLQVVFHIDRSDPVVAVTLTSHVGSAREIEGRTGFAHLFEHLLFLESENLGKGGLDKMSARIGGSGANGSTSRDRTNYFQTVPNDALEKMIWAEADKLGWFINTVTEPVLAKEKQVVKNEKRQSVDNRPYGHTQYVIDQNLYPEGHPYSWQVIGSLDDLQSATLQNVKDFFNRWYVPNNVTLVVAGDFEPEQAKEWVEKYFSEIKSGEEIPPIKKQAAVLDETVRFSHEDNFARLPELTFAWPGVFQYHPDSYPLEVLAQYLSEGKKAPFYKVLVEEKQLTSNVRMFNYNSEAAGQVMLRVRAYDGVDLNEVVGAFDQAFMKFETDGISEKDLDRIKAGQETSFYNGLSSVLGKSFQLAQYEIFAGDPGFINEDIKNILGVTQEDVMRVYEKYIKDKNYVATSFVPLGQGNLALEGSEIAAVVEEEIVEGAEEQFDASLTAEYERTPSSFDRTIEPPYGPNPQVSVPTVWEDATENGMKVYGVTNEEVPLVRFNITMKGGLLLDDSKKVGVANLVAELMTKGTKNKTPLELEEAIEGLGANISINARNENFTISGNTLARNYEKTLALVQEMLLEPRWDENEFILAKQSTVSRIKQQEASPVSLAQNNYRIIIYGKDHILSNNILGSEESVETIGMDDLKDYYATNLSPTIARFHVVGDIDKTTVMSSLESLGASWEQSEVTFPEYKIPPAPEQSIVYFYDVPDAKQSRLQFGYSALAATDEDYFPATLMNYRLGGGGFASQLTQELREGKGYTYGISSSFQGTDLKGPFTIGSGVRSNVTYESASLVKEILQNYGPNYNENDLEITQGFMIKSNARAFETLGSKLNMLQNISAYNWPHDYVKQREKIVMEMTVERIQELAGKYLNADKMLYLVVGDAETQLEKLKELGYGDPILINNKSIEN